MGVDDEGASSQSKRIACAKCISFRVFFGAQFPNFFFFAKTFSLFLLNPMFRASFYEKPFFFFV